MIDSFVTLAESVVRTGLWEVIFSTIVFAAVWPVTRLLPRRFHQLRYMLWALVLIRLVLPPTLALPYSAGTLAVSPALELGNGQILALPVSEPGTTLPGEPAAFGVPVVGGAGHSLLPSAVLFCWLAGVALVGMTLLRRRQEFRRIVRRARPIDDPGAQNVSRLWRQRFGIHRSVRLLESDELAVPFTLGTMSHVIVLPVAACRSLSPASVECAIAHEMAHIKRRDDLFLLLSGVVTTLYFFHPLAWLAADRMRDAADGACDALVLGQGSIAPKSYGRAVLAFVSNAADARPCPAPAMARRGARITKRLESIVQRSRKSPPAYVTAAGTVLLGAFLLPLSTADRINRLAEADVFELSAVEAERIVLDYVREQDIEIANPVPGARLASRYDSLPRSRPGGMVRHTGIDLAAPQGTPVLAAASGTVRYAGSDYDGQPRRGNVVVVDHGDGYQTYYGHLHSIEVTEGQAVTRGTEIATVGSSGVSTGPHLHFEIWHNNVTLDPKPYREEWQD